MIRKSRLYEIRKRKKKRERTKNTTVRNFKQIQLGGKGVVGVWGWGSQGFTNGVVMSFTLNPMSSHLREIFAAIPKIIGTEKISRNNNNTVT